MRNRFPFLDQTRPTAPHVASDHKSRPISPPLVAPPVPEVSDRKQLRAGRHVASDRNKQLSPPVVGVRARPTRGRVPAIPSASFSCLPPRRRRSSGDSSAVQLSMTPHSFRSRSVRAESYKDQVRIIKLDLSISKESGFEWW